MIHNNWQHRLLALAVSAGCCIAMAFSVSDKGSEEAPADNVNWTFTQPSNDILFYDAQREAALDYLRSPERVRQYEDDFEKASVLIASAIDSGYFATTSGRYNADWESRPDWYAGPGEISTPDGRTFARVDWNADGSINYKKGIESFTLSLGNATVSIAKSDMGDGPFLGAVQEHPRGYLYVVSPQFSKGPLTAEQNWLLPTDQSDLVATDQMRRRMLDLMMAATFRTKNWRDAYLVGSHGNVHLAYRS